MMNARTLFVLLTIFTVVGALTMSSVYAQACIGCEADDGKMARNKMLPSDFPISVWTDKATYEHNGKITVYGKVSNVSGFPVTLTVVNPIHSVISIAQLNVANDGTFGTTLNTGGTGWKQNGTYTIKVNYGTTLKSDKVFIELTGEALPETSKCGVSEISIEDICIPYSISGGRVTGASVNTDDKSIIIRMITTEDGVFTFNPPKTVIDGIFMVLVDGEEWDDVEISDGQVTVMFPAGAEKIEVIGTFVIPEFGAIAAMILVVAIISVIAISARSRLSIIPRY